MVSGIDWLRWSLPSRSGEDGAHLLEAKGDLAAFFFAGVGDYGEVGGVDFEPGIWFGGGRSRYRAHE